MPERLFLRLDGDPLYAPETGAPAGTLREFDVAAPLRGHVAGIAACRERIPDGLEVEERVLPDGALRLVFHLGDLPLADGGQGGRAILAGANAAPLMLRMRGRVEGWSVTLLPGAAQALIGLPAGELAGSAVSLEDVWGADGRELLARLVEAPDDPTRAVLLQRMLLRRLGADDRGMRQQAMHAARLIAQSGGRRPLREVAEAIGVGERRLQQIFHAQVGLAPRAWSRLARLHALLRALRRHPSPRWSEVAIDAGFYDQSHLVNEFRALCGLTPLAFMERAGAASGSSKTGA